MTEPVVRVELHDMTGGGGGPTGPSGPSGSGFNSKEYLEFAAQKRKEVEEAKTREFEKREALIAARDTRRREESDRRRIEREQKKLDDDDRKFLRTLDMRRHDERLKLERQLTRDKMKLEEFYQKKIFSERLREERYQKRREADALEKANRRTADEKMKEHIASTLGFVATERAGRALGIPSSLYYNGFKLGEHWFRDQRFFGKKNNPADAVQLENDPDARPHGSWSAKQEEELLNSLQFPTRNQQLREIAYRFQNGRGKPENSPSTPTRMPGETDAQFRTRMGNAGQYQFYHRGRPVGFNNAPAGSSAFESMGGFTAGASRTLPTSLAGMAAGSGGGGGAAGVGGLLAAFGGGGGGLAAAAGPIGIGVAILAAGAVAGGIAALTFAKAVQSANGMINDQIDKFARYSGAISGARALQNMEVMQQRIKRARELEDETVEFTHTQTRALVNLEATMTNLFTLVGPAILQLATMVEGITAIAKDVSLVAKNLPAAQVAMVAMSSSFMPLPGTIAQLYALVDNIRDWFVDSDRKNLKFNKELLEALKKIELDTDREKSKKSRGRDIL